MVWVRIGLSEKIGFPNTAKHRVKIFEKNYGTKELEIFTKKVFRIKTKAFFH